VTQSQTGVDVGVHPAVGERAKEEDEREDGEKKRSTEQDDPVSELHIVETLDEILGGGSFVAVVPPTNASMWLWRRLPNSIRDGNLLLLHDVRLFLGHRKVADIWRAASNYDRRSLPPKAGRD
jgi:hypothetical protein